MKVNKYGWFKDELSSLIGRNWAIQDDEWKKKDCASGLGKNRLALALSQKLETKLVGVGMVNVSEVWVFFQTHWIWVGYGSIK